MSTTPKTPNLLQDVVSPLALFHHFLDDLVCNPPEGVILTDEVSSCLDAGVTILRESMTKVTEAHNCIDILTVKSRLAGAR